MGDLIYMNARKTRDGHVSLGTPYLKPAEERFTQIGSHKRGKIVHFDTVNRDLFSLQYRGRKSDDRKPVLYKGSTTVNLSDNDETADVTVRVFVKTRRLEYYFFCPWSGKRVRGRVDCRAHCGTDCVGLTWPEVQKMVRRHILKKNHKNRHQTGQSRDVSDPVASYSYSDKQLFAVPMAAGGFDDDSEKDTLFHRFLRKLSARWSVRR